MLPAPYARISKKILPDWEVSLVFLDAKTARALNKKLRRKSYTPNVLSYIVGEKSGEVILCKEVARKQAPEFGLSFSNFLLFLFIHALLHLKGGRHGTTMERREWALLERFAPGASAHLHNGSSHRNWNRRRHVSGEGRRGRRNRR